MKFSNKQISILCLIIWIGLLIFAVIDNKGLFWKDTLDVSTTLGSSAFARGMFLDIGILSILVSLWMIFFTKNKYKFVFAFLTIFLGSFAVLPYLSIYFWDKEKIL